MPTCSPDTRPLPPPEHKPYRPFAALVTAVASGYAQAMTSFNLRQVKLRSGEQFRDEQEIELEPFVFGGERYLPVPERVAAELDDQSREHRHGLRAPLPGARARALPALPRRTPSSRRASPRASTRRRIPARPTSCDARTSATTGSTSRAWARDALALALPEQILCRPDCAGLCPVCGKDLNREPHEHEEERADPRWAALAELRDRL